MSPQAAAEAVDLTLASQQLNDAFSLAAADRPVETHTLRLGQQVIRLHFAGRAMAAKILPALAHLGVPPAVQPVDLTVRIWDTASTSSRLPNLPAAVLWPGTVLAHPLHDGRVWLSLRQWESSISVLDTERREALYCVADAEAVAPYEIAHPLTEILRWWFARAGLHLVHAAAVGTDAGGVLLAGPSGAGKSTSALVCLRAGMHFTGDDSVLVSGDPPLARCLYSSGRADVALLRDYPDLLPALELPSGEAKAVSFFDRSVLTAELPLRAIVRPSVVPGGTCRLRPQRRGAALLDLAPAPVLQQRQVGHDAFADLSRLVGRLPTHALEVGDDLERIPQLLSDLISRPAPCA